MLRRDVLIGLGAAALVPSLLARAQGSANADLRAVLDGLGGIEGYRARLAALDRFDPASLGAAARLDLLAVRHGLGIDARLAELVPGGRTDGPYRLPAAGEPGMWRRRNGDEAFALLLSRHVGQAIGPERAHRRFEREVATLSARADRLMRGQGLSRGSVGDRYRRLFADPRWLYSDDGAGRDAAVAAMNGWLHEARGDVARLIGPVPAKSLDASVRRMSAADEAAGRQGYRQIPSAIQSGIYFVDLKDIRRRPSWSLKSVVHHELLPGHMVHVPIEEDAGGHPLRAAYLSGFAEGWAIHSEALMASAGAYRGAPLEELGHVHWMLFRAVRGLIDTGFNHRRWTLAQVQAAQDRHMGVPVYFASFESDHARIANDPGGRVGEAGFWLAISERVGGLRGAALRSAHQQILAGGRKPLHWAI